MPDISESILSEEVTVPQVYAAARSGEDYSATSTRLVGVVLREGQFLVCKFFDPIILLYSLPNLYKFNKNIFHFNF